MFSGRLGLALVLVALCLGGQTARAQTGAVAYWIPGWPLGFGSLAGSQSLNTYGNFPSFDGQAGGYTRYNFPNGMFVGGEGGSAGLSMNGLTQDGAFGSLTYQGVQFGYNFQNSPLTLYGGFDTFKYNSGIGSPLAPFTSTSTTLPGYSAHAGVEFRPTSNLNLSLGFSYTQQSGAIDSDSSQPSLSNASPFDLVGGRH